MVIERDISARSPKFFGDADIVAERLSLFPYLRNEADEFVYLPSRLCSRRRPNRKTLLHGRLDLAVGKIARRMNLQIRDVRSGFYCGLCARQVGNGHRQTRQGLDRLSPIGQQAVDPASFALSLAYLEFFEETIRRARRRAVCEPR